VCVCVCVCDGACVCYVLGVDRVDEGDTKEHRYLKREILKTNNHKQG
jgi:hypothetical protein